MEGGGDSDSVWIEAQDSSSRVTDEQTETFHEDDSDYENQFTMIKGRNKVGPQGTLETC